MVFIQNQMLYRRIFVLTSNMKAYRERRRTQRVELLHKALHNVFDIFRKSGGHFESKDRIVLPLAKSSPF